MPENKITILSTGKLDLAQVEKAAAKNIMIEVIPFISTVFIHATEWEILVQPFLSQAASVIFTSGNAVEAVGEATKNTSPAWDIYCTGYNTKLLAEKYFPSSQIVAVADNAEGLADEIAEKKINEPVLFFCGDQRRQELPGKLELAGIIVKEIVVYRTKPTPVKLDKKYNGILFFSPSAVQSFFSENEVDNEPVLFAIGNTTLKALQAFSVDKMLQSETPEKEKLVDLAIEYFKQ